MQIIHSDDDDLTCRTGGLEGPARYTSARAKRENDREALSKNNPLFLASRFARALVYRAGPSNPPVLQANDDQTENV